MHVSQNSDVTIAVIGLTRLLEGEEGVLFSPNPKAKNKYECSSCPNCFLPELRGASNEAIFAVVTAPSAPGRIKLHRLPITIIPASILVNRAVRRLPGIIFCTVFPSRRLPVTFYISFSHLPAYGKYAIQEELSGITKDGCSIHSPSVLSYAMTTHGCNSPQLLTMGRRIRIALTVSNRVMMAPKLYNALSKILQHDIA
jgi:hypothetical protein